MKKLSVFILLVMLIAICSAGAEEISRDFTVIRINEIMASNSSKVLTAQDGSSPDWIELYNTSDKDVNLEGLCLSDSKNNPEKFVFPEVIIPAHGYLIIFCKGEESVDGNEICAAFKLAAEGEKAVLSYEGVILQRIDFEAQMKDISLAFGEDEEWHQTVTPTPGYANVITGLD